MMLRGRLETFASAVRWAGSKRLLVPKLRDFLPRTYRRYYEPMVGSGALFFALRPSQAYLSDTNPELIHFYRVLSRVPRALYRHIARLRISQKTYYALRGQRPTSPVPRAARFFFLIRLSWNGLYRVNQQGVFNVPYSGRCPRSLVSFERLAACAAVLRTASVRTGDFAECTTGARAGDFVYFDPPYPRGAWADNGFARYSRSGFPLSEHARLARCATRLADRGVHVLITEAARKDFLALYPTDFCVTIVRKPSLIAAASAHRRDAYEAILTSYRV